MADIVHGDFETKSAKDLPAVGQYRYAEDPSTGIWMLCWAFDPREVHEWRPGDPAPDRLLDHVARGGRFVAHHANFERQIWNTTLLRFYPGWPRLTIQQMDCTMARALALHLPANLDDLAKVLGLVEQKDTEGSTLMKKMARPRKIHADGSITWWDEPANVDRLGGYCRQDVRTEFAADRRLVPLSAEERELWELDQEINDRGCKVDLDMINRIVVVLQEAQERANLRMHTITSGAVEKVTQPTRLVDWLVGRGIPCDSMAKGNHDELIEIAKLRGDDHAKAAIELRREAGKTSTAKFARMLEYVCKDGRLHGLFGYHRASTGRWGGAGPQPQNLPRVDGDRDLPDVLTTLAVLERFAAHDIVGATP